MYLWMVLDGLMLRQMHIPGANLATINDQSEHEWLMKTYKDHGMNMEVQTGVRHLFIGLTRHDGTGPKSTNAAGYSDGWISGEDSGWRPPYWGQHGEQKNADGELIIDPSGNLQKEGHQPGANYTALNILRGSQGDIHINWNDFSYHTGKGLAEVPIPNCNE